MADAEDPRKRPEPSRDKDKSQMMVITGLALSIPWLLFAPILIGFWLDDYFHTSPWITVVSFALAIFATGFDMWVILKRVGMFE